MAAMILPAAAWRTLPGLADLCAVLDAGAGASRFVGGAVRDTLLGLPVADIDIATRLMPGDVLDRLKAAGIRAVPTGLAHGTITAVLPGGPVEVTTLRRDVATDGRRATIAYTDDWREDAARRDFTINALYADPVTGALFDYFGGAADLAAGHVRFIGDPLRRIAEDHLRILRFFRFVSRFADTPDAAGLAACTARANDLMALSRERIADELMKLLVTARAPQTVSLMIAHGIIAAVLPEITDRGAQRLAIVAAREAGFAIAPDPIRRLAALLPDDPAVAESVGARLKLSKAHRKRLITALGRDAEPSPRVLVYRIGHASTIDRLLIGAADDAEIAQALAEIGDWAVPSLPITGGALVERGLAQGPDVARALRCIEDRWLAAGFPAGDAFAAIVDDVVAQALRAINNA